MFNNFLNNIMNTSLWLRTFSLFFCMKIVVVLRPFYFLRIPMVSQQNNDPPLNLNKFISMEIFVIPMQNLRCIT